MTAQLSFDFNPHQIRAKGYQGVHDQIRRMWGKASEHRCVNPTKTAKCKGRAAQWAYDGTDHAQDIYQQVERPGRPAQTFAFSIWPEFYMPLCRPCHKRLDLAALGRPIKPYKRHPAQYQRDLLQQPKTDADWQQWYAEQGKCQYVDEEGHDLRVLWMVMRETSNHPS